MLRFFGRKHHFCDKYRHGEQVDINKILWLLGESEITPYALAIQEKILLKKLYLLEIVSSHGAEVIALADKIELQKL